MKELSTKNIDLIAEYFRKVSFHESVVIRLELLPNNDLYIIDCARVNWELPQGKREFCRISFENISSFRYNKGISKSFIFSPIDFKTLNSSYTLEIDEIKLCQGRDTEKNVKIFLPLAFGAIEFQFDSVFVIKRIGNGKMIAENKWEYRDEETNIVFDFFDPFNGIK